MKKLIMMAALAVGAVCLTGCDPVMESADTDRTWTYHGNGCMTKIVTIENHKYVVLSGYKMGNIVHAASCECANRGM